MMRKALEARVMADTVETLILDLLEWVQLRDRSYRETMDAWRTSCPRLPIWEDANDRGLIETLRSEAGLFVRVTPSGLALLRERRPAATA
jgi:D-3-phosphoglycerate dehydrogenase